MNILTHFHQKGFVTILVNFDIPDRVLMDRVINSNRSTTIFRTASTFEEVLIRQQTDSYGQEVSVPTDNEANYLFEIKAEEDVSIVSQKIVEIAENLVIGG
jgi:hypothetical protein